MVEELPEPMPEDVRDAFRDAVKLYAVWKSGGPENSVSFRKFKYVSLAGVCDLVLSYRNEPLPIKLHDELWNLVDKVDTDLKVELATDPSYATAAHCLTRLIENHRAEDGRRKIPDGVERPPPKAPFPV